MRNKLLTSSAMKLYMNQFVGHKWILVYFQVLGLHSVHKNAFLYKILLIVSFLISYVIAIYFKTFERDYDSVTGVVSLLESKFINIDGKLPFD